jgi:UPF0755 protein
LRILRSLLAFGAVVVLVAAAAGSAYLWFLRTVAAPGPLAAPATVFIAPGTGLKGVARQLADAGVVRASWMVEIEARRSGQARALKPGEYRFAAGISLVEALGKIVRREVVAHFLTIPEGLVAPEVLRLVVAAEALQGPPPEALKDGDVLPETYRYEWGDTRAGLVARMRQARDAALAELWAARAEGLPLATPEEALILASIVEKETGLAAERPRVAAVFLNRLRRGMRLQSDPTVSYGLAPEGLGRSLIRADLERPSPFNTYLIDRLPPAPICNPGRASLAAVLAPASTDDLYFVADGDGGHAFAATLEQHNRNVARWRAAQRRIAD